MFVAGEIKQKLLHKFSEVFIYSPFISKKPQKYSCGSWGPPPRVITRIQYPGAERVKSGYILNSAKYN